MFHVCGFFRPDSDPISASSDAILPAIVDGYLQTTNQRFVSQKPLKIYWGYAFNDDIRAARIESDELRNVSPYYLVPPTQFNDSLDISDIMLPSVDRMVELKLPKEFGAVVTTGTTVNQNNPYFVFLWLGDGNFSAPSGPTFSMKFTFVENKPPGLWNPTLLTPTHIIPAGTYAVVGGTIAPHNQDICIVAWRLRFINQDWMPGAIAQEFPGDPYPKVFRHGRMGLWGTFTETSLPVLEFQTFMAAGNLTADVYLDVVRIR